MRVEIAHPEGIRWNPECETGDGVLVLAGSSGRIDGQRARIFAGEGCVAESIRWFGGPGQHDGPWDIPLEMFLGRIDVLKRDCDRVYVVGTSFGAEAALLCGAHSASVDGVVAFAPSDVVWAGYDGAHAETSHWTLTGARLPYVPFDWRQDVKENPPRFRPLYEGSRQTFAEHIPAATIAVEGIRSLILVAGGDDQVWPSVAHAERIQRLRASHGLTTTIVAEREAGHRTVLPGEPVVTGGMTMQRGGTEAADRRLGSRAWEVITDLFALSR
ncbi:BAAT / Acyl-CoA thioester hydrolase C terminal [Cryobacterium flavum]|nr:acyl-CoA thioester hydrolase/BAAT C-terminal domain-containing protein [Cryobacterium flavum]SDO05516.1 BAAT / Acyl-CoA thioester hydrolase C terminal [Cryobacterium flavum]